MTLLWLFLANPHIILQISHVKKTFEMTYTRCPYNNIIQKYSQRQIMCGSNLYPKSLENSKSALVCCSDELRGWVCNDTQRVKIAFQPLQASIRANWEFSSNCDTTPHFWGYLVLVLLCLVLFLIQLAIKVSKSNIQTYHWVFKCKRPRRFSYFC